MPISKLKSCVNYFPLKFNFIESSLDFSNELSQSKNLLLWNTTAICSTVYTNVFGILEMKIPLRFQQSQFLAIFSLYINAQVSL